nr:MAG: phosphohydrolase [Thermoproteus sp. AZ2]
MYIISDIHIGSPRSKIKELRQCLQRDNIDILVIAGDIYEKEYRRVEREEAHGLFERLIKVLGVRPKLMIVSLSSSSHDPQIGHFVGEVDGVEVDACNCPISFNYMGEEYVVVHGDIAVGDGVLAYIIDRIRPGAVGRILRRKLKLYAKTWLIYGHSHVPYLSLEERILNPGSWKAYGIRRTLGAVYEMPSARPICKPTP